MKKANRRNGFSLVEVMIVVAIIGLLAAIAIPNFVRARQESWRNHCRSNLKIISDAKIVACAEAKPSALLSFEGESGATFLAKLGKICPAGGTYTLGACGQTPTCSFGNHVLLVAEVPKSP